MLKEVRASLYNKNGKAKLNILLNVLIAFVILVLAVEICFSVNYSGVYVVDRSMNPTLTGASSEDVIGGDYVYINKHAKPKFQDIVVVYHKQEGYLIKRAIAFGGDRVMLVEGQLFIKKKGESDFERIDEDYILCSDTSLPRNNFGSAVGGELVPEGYFFLMGDNRDYSVDSRELGCFPLSSLDGVVTNWSIEHKGFCTGLYNYFRFKLPSYFGIK
ncbi:MAG: signal peptidase I [Clostridia bacterium]|nr:signal peptidase I [Clostridia bacterium]